jgi:hypothetical protein
MASSADLLDCKLCKEMLRWRSWNTRAGKNKSREKRQLMNPQSKTERITDRTMNDIASVGDLDEVVQAGHNLSAVTQDLVVAVHVGLRETNQNNVGQMKKETVKMKSMKHNRGKPALQRRMQQRRKHS